MNYHFNNEIHFEIIIEFETKVKMHTIQYFKYSSIPKVFPIILLEFNAITIGH